VLERKDAISHIKKTKLYFGSKFFEDKTLILIIALDYSSSLIIVYLTKIKTRHTASTGTHWHFTFGTMLS